MRTPSLLWVTSEPADRQRAGGSIRQSYLLEAVARSMEVDVLAVGAGVDEQCERVVHHVETLPEPIIRRHRRWVPGAAREVWEGEMLRMTPAVADTRRHRASLRARLRTGSLNYDLVHVEHDRLALLASEIRSPRRTVTLHNLRSEQAAHRLAIETSPAHRWLARRARSIALAFEQRVIRDFDAVFVTSPTDAKALPGDPMVVPNGVDLQEIRPVALGREPRMVFIGLLDWQPNVQGIVWFVRSVLPRIREALPTAHLSIVGRNPVREVTALTQPGVEIHPNVPTVIPFLREARVALVPLHVGSGTRLKALEAMAAGRPVVGTSIGLDGIGIQSGVQATVVDEPEAMADAIIRLMRDHSAAEAMGAAGRRHVEQHFDWRQIAHFFSATMLELAVEL
jgi:glycosyltransferase involved in cell wall biosynthesis